MECSFLKSSGLCSQSMSDNSYYRVLYGSVNVVFELQSKVLHLGYLPSRAQVFFFNDKFHFVPDVMYIETS